ncbi:DUF3995 domain-containing protein [Streptomyces sp. NBC_01381]|uniref:DUF3995 domain-containing protein n=1 Tax=Streptomyces sp. NBC_01381 TaxID=2903845 RepID=UPI0022525509|nr:DUF3995 domain-containing protein [Streptomyces sp. NBC_01381]MCX4667165.1 DUF3995 domain-containing protein [Streptomyces sp. NBC_01381]
MPRHPAATLIAAVLTTDALLHLYWATGQTWPAASEQSLSYAVLGADVPFTPPILIPLATLLLTASALVLAGSRPGTLAVAAGLSLRTLAGVYWLFAKETDTAFYWLNLGLYTPLCAILCAAAVRVARREEAVRVR